MQLSRIGDPTEAERCLDVMEQATGLSGEPNSDGRLYKVEAENLSRAADRIAAHLPKGWQDQLVFEL